MPIYRPLFDYSLKINITQYKVYCNFIIVWNSGFVTAASEQNYSLFNESLLKREQIFSLKFMNNFIRTQASDFFQEKVQLKLCFIKMI